MKKNFQLLIAFVLLCLFQLNAQVTVNVNSGNPVSPFPRFSNYENADDTLKTLGSDPQQGQSYEIMEQIMRDAYQVMMNSANYTGAELDGVKYISVEVDGLGEGSEAYGYALLAAAYMADKTTFDGLWLQFHDALIPNGQKYLDCSAQEASAYGNSPAIFVGQDGSYTAGDADVTLAMAVAYKQWGSSMNVTDACGSVISYAEELKILMHAMVDTLTPNIGTDKLCSGIIGLDGYVKQGNLSTEVTDWSSNNTLNGQTPLFPGKGESDVYGTAPAYYREFYNLIETDFSNENWSMKDQFLRAANSSDWIVGTHYNSSELAIPVASVYTVDGNSLMLDEIQAYGDLQWSWRNALSYLWFGNSKFTWNPLSHDYDMTSNSYQKDMALRYAKYLSNPQSEPWNQDCLRGGVSTNVYYQGIETISEMSKDGTFEPSKVNNWGIGTGATSLVVGQDLKVIAKAFRQCDVLWQAKKINSGGTTSEAKYGDSWFRLLGMLVLTGNMQAPSNIATDVNVRLHSYVYNNSIVFKYRNYDNADALNTIITCELPDGVSSETLPNGATYNSTDNIIQIDLGTVSYSSSFSEIIIPVAIEYGESDLCFTASIKASNSEMYNAPATYTSTEDGIQYQSCFTGELSALEITQTLSKEYAKDGDTLLITVDAKLPFPKVLYGGTHGINFNAGFSTSTQQASSNEIEFVLRHDGNVSYLNAENFRLCYYFYDENLVDVNSEYVATIIHAEGVEKSDVHVQLEKIQLVEDGDKRANARMIIEFSESYFAPSSIHESFYGLSDYIHKGSPELLKCIVQLRTEDYSVRDWYKDWSFDKNAVVTNNEIPLISLQYDDYSGVSNEIVKPDNFCTESSMTTTGIVVEEFDGNNWRVVAGNAPDVGSLFFATIKDTLPEELEFVDFEAQDLVGGVPTYDVEKRVISWEGTNIPTGRNLHLSYKVKAKTETYSQVENKVFVSALDMENEASQMIFITKGVQPDPIQIDLSISNASSPTQNNGEILATVSGGVGDYEISLNGNPVSLPISDLPIGEYILQVKDASGSVKDTAFVVDVTEEYEFNPFELQSTHFCKNVNVLDAGAGFESYTWNDASVLQTLEVSSVGDYSVTVSDKLGNKYVDEISFIAVEEFSFVAPESVYIGEAFTVEGLGHDYRVMDVADRLYYSDTGEPVYIDNNTTHVEPDGNAYPYHSINNTYVYRASNDFTLENDISVMMELGSEATCVPEGEEAYGVRVAKEVLIMSRDYDIVTNAIVVNASDDTDNGSITLEHDGLASNHRFIWSNDEHTSRIENLSPGTYFVTVTDSVGIVNVLEYEIKSVSKERLIVNAEPETIEVYLLGGEEYKSERFISKISIDQTSMLGVAEVSDGNEFVYTPPSNGAFEETVIVYSKQFFEDDTRIIETNGVINYNIHVANPLTIDEAITGSLYHENGVNCELVAQGGFSPYTYYLNEEIVSSILTNIPPGTYHVKVVDNKGKIVETEFSVDKGTNVGYTIAEIKTDYIVGEDFSSQLPQESGVTVEMVHYATYGTSALDSEHVYTYSATNEFVGLVDTVIIESVTEPVDETSLVQVELLIQIFSILAPLEPEPEYKTVDLYVLEGDTLDLGLWNIVNGQSSAVVKDPVHGTFDIGGFNGEEILNTTYIPSGDGAVLDSLVYQTTIHSQPHEKNIYTTYYFHIAPQIQIATEVTDETYIDIFDGAIQITITGGFAEYVYSWSNDEVEKNISNLSQGTYTVTVVDSQGFTAEQTIPIGRVYADPMYIDTDSIESVYKNQSLNLEVSDVEIVKAPLNGDLSNTFVYTPNKNFIGVEIVQFLKQTYHDENNLYLKESVAISYEIMVLDFEPLSVNEIVNNETAMGEDGSIALTVSGGVKPYEYTWELGENTSAITGLSAGTYFVTITDEIGNRLEREYEVVDEQTLLFLEGAVWEGTEKASSAVVLLFEKVADEFVPVRVKECVNGVFRFENLHESVYSIYVIPSLQSGYLPTYYANQLRWDNAYEIDLSTSLIGLDVDLLSVVKYSLGKGVINGLCEYMFTGEDLRVFSSELFSSIKTDSENGVLPVFLEKDGNVIAWTLTNSDGAFQFENVPLGTYTVSMEKPGARFSSTDVVLTAENSEIDEVAILALSTELILSNSSISVYPNPVRDIIYIENDVRVSAVTAVDLKGCKIELPILSEQVIDASRLSIGAYTLLIQAHDAVLVKAIFKQ